MIPKDIQVAQFIYIIRSQIKIDSTMAIFIFVDDPHTGGKDIPASHTTIGKLYDKYADKDGFLYISYSAQLTFG